MATTVTMESSQSLVQSERTSRVYTQEGQLTEHKLKKKKSTRRHKDEGTISVSKSSERLHKKLKADGEGAACERCSRPVFAMERVKAERRVWHRECFRCARCDKQLTVETYQSEHTTLYCRPHFKLLHAPKPVDADDTDAAPKKHQMIICESNPVELPPDVARASDKPDLGLDSLSSLDVKARFEVFERSAAPAAAAEPAPRAQPRSAALLDKMAKFKPKDTTGVPDACLHGAPGGGSDADDDEDSVLRSSYAAAAAAGGEAAAAGPGLRELRGRFERAAPDERHRTRKQEIQNIRSRLFMGKQAKIKEMYEQSVLQSEQAITSAEKLGALDEVDGAKARAIKHRFESGQVFRDDAAPPRRRSVDDDVFQEGIGKQSRSIFLELDANAKGRPAAAAPPPPPKRKEIPFVPTDVVRADARVEETPPVTADIGDKFRFFETYRAEQPRKQFRMTPPPRDAQVSRSPSPEPYRDPAVCRGDRSDDAGAVPPRAAARVISVFRLMEDQRQAPAPQGPKPLKRFTPPPPGACRGDSSGADSGADSDGDSADDSDDSEAERRRLAEQRRAGDDALQQAQQLARTRSFRERFENWSESGATDDRPAATGATGPNGATGPCGLGDRQASEEEGESQLETAKSLRAKFEGMQMERTVTKTAPRVNRFV